MAVFMAISTMSCTFPNEQHCWVMQGDLTCMELFKGGFCSSDRPTCEGHGVPYGCVFTRPIEDECYSPAGDNASCADAEPDPRCTSADQESGESETSDMEMLEGSGTSVTSPEVVVCASDPGPSCDIAMPIQSFQQ